ncbi:MAG: ATP-binding cassette domain-containing protein [Acidimicrobiia bacterium]|nr:ATP-binding cassette domain-containing protein [Acidimicrobiia bacterium]
MIEARSLGKSFSDVRAVDDVSFTVAPGQVLGLHGPNGAGKTTVVRMLTTLTSIGAGSASIFGRDVASEAEAVRNVIGLAGQAAAVDEKLSARENLRLFARLYKLPRPTQRQRVAELIERFDMTDFADRPASTYSGGQRRRLDIVAALVAEPLALFLDEPTTGLDPRSRAEVWESIRSLAAEGTAIVLTTQYLEEADQLAHEILMIDRGRTVATGSPETLKKAVGSDVLQISVASHVDLALVQSLLTGDSVVDAKNNRLDVPITGGARQSLDVLRRLEDQDVALADFQLRRPTLDDAFLALTGAPATDREGVRS